jgi:hypothetical protein
VRGRGVPLDERGHLIAIAFGHPDVGEDDVRAVALYAIDRVLPVAHRDDLHVLVRERQLDDPLDGDAVVCQQEFVRHPS